MYENCIICPFGGQAYVLYTKHKINDRSIPLAQPVAEAARPIKSALALIEETTQTSLSKEMWEPGGRSDPREGIRPEEDHKGGLEMAVFARGSLAAAAIMVVSCLSDVVGPNPGGIVAWALTEDKKAL